MLVFPFVRKTIAGLALAFALPAGVIAQSTGLTNSGEYLIAGSLPGDQVRPQLSLNSSGGYLVWQDNATDPDGMGISARALDVNFIGAGLPFRVNQRGAGDQEKPRVSLLNDGGAAFVWQTRLHPGFYNVFARFLSSGSTWLTGDMQVNASARNFLQSPEPALATLTNGLVVVVWGGFNQLSLNSMQDVFGQLFSPAGLKIGGEFLVNQFTPFNQRSPAIAPLASGGFVIAWVSEQQRNAPPNLGSTSASYTPSGVVASRASVDIFARLFDASGAPLGDEFLVNTGSDVCANPSIAPAPDGGFMIAWSQKDMNVQTNGWDVFSRPFSSAGVGGTVRRINTWVFGDQRGPQLSAAGTNFLALWTSFGQDGSDEGVFGQFLQADGSPSGAELQVNTTTVGSQKQPALGSDNYGRFLAVWTSFALPSHSFDLFAKAFAPANFIPAPVAFHYGPPPPETFIDGAPPPAGSSPVSDPYATSLPGGLTLDFPAPDSSASSGVLSNAFARAQGSYNGLFYDANGVTAVSSGYLGASTTARGAYSARLILGGRAFSLAGRFDPVTGWATNLIRQGSALLTVQLKLDLAGADQISGHVTDGNWWADLVAYRLVFNKKNPASAYAGNYTLAFPPAADGPAGTGFGTVKVDSGGNLQWSGTLADGTTVSQSSALSDQGIWPLFVSLYSGGGSIISWLQFTTNHDCGGSLIWIKPAASAAKYYPQGFTNELKAAGSLYLRPASRARVLQLNAGGSLIFSGGGLSLPFTNPFALDLNNRLVNPPGSKLSLNITVASGLFRGNTINPETGRLFPFQGALFENDNTGAGFFLGTNLSGQVFLTPAP